MINNVYAESKIKIESVNLHIHSKFSDGVLKPREILNVAKNKKIRLISITDHDTIDAYNHIPSNHEPLLVLPGIEFSSSWKGDDVHVLGYGIDVHNKQLREVLIWMQKGRHSRAEKILEKLSLMGIKIPFEHVLSFTGEMNLVVRPHIAQALILNKHCRNKQEAFQKYIGNDAPAYVPKPILSTPEVIGFIHEAGGVAVIAHPGKLKSTSYIEDFIKQGVDGLEVCHPDHNYSMIKELEEICIEHGIYQTGGSDFHGEENSTNHLGASLVTENVLSDVQEIWDNYNCSRV